jgi:thiol-disulfide isomerase/thioredoxin
MFSFRLVPLSAAVIALITCIGCSRRGLDQPRLPTTVSGTVRYGDQPVWEGRLTLLGPDERVSTTTLNSDGTFQIVNPPLGVVKVGVSNYPRGQTSAETEVAVVGLAGQAECTAPQRDSVELPKRYAEPDHSGLTLEIKSGQQQLDLSLPLQEGDPLPVVRPLRAIGPEPGNEAPEIRGEDLSGEVFSLSDYRGKVVLLVFWAHWCNLCREQFPHYAAIADRMEGQPFALLGVNCDPDRELVHRENPQRGINWRSWWDGASVGGPVFHAYALEGFPCAVLIDQDGIIRHRQLRGADLDRAIDAMMRAAGNEPPREPVVSHTAR